jgi:hypothetical protein
MSDHMSSGKAVPMNTAEVPQHKRMAAGEAVDGKSMPSAKGSTSKTPA